MSCKRMPLVLVLCNHMRLHVRIYKISHLFSVFWLVNTFLEVTCLISYHCSIWVLGSLTENTISKFAKEIKGKGSPELRQGRSSVVTRMWYFAWIPSQSVPRVHGHACCGVAWLCFVFLCPQPFILHCHILFYFVLYW